MLGNLPSNNRDIEGQIMKRFLRDQIVLNISKPNLYHDVFAIFLNKHQPSSRGTLNEIEVKSLTSIAKLASR